MSNQRTSLGKSALLGWLSIIFLAGAWVIFSRPSEIGRIGSFIFWAMILTFFYVADFLMIAVPFHTLLAAKLETLDVLMRTFMGGFLFALTVPVWSLLLGHLDAHDIFVHIGFAFIGGCVSFFSLVTPGQ